ncbi:hypothetical protein, partial [Rhizobium mesoamericanum]|uniref:hypothetical protein n=1 Tax=Rhizobium mesoamericanum TaxID=1079800 RepID=UPI001AD82898
VDDDHKEEQSIHRQRGRWTQLGDAGHASYFALILQSCSICTLYRSEILSRISVGKSKTAQACPGVQVAGISTGTKSGWR